MSQQDRACFADLLMVPLSWDVEESQTPGEFHKLQLGCMDALALLVQADLLALTQSETTPADCVEVVERDTALLTKDKTVSSALTDDELAPLRSRPRLIDLTAGGSHANKPLIESLEPEFETEPSIIMQSPATSVARPHIYELHQTSFDADLSSDPGTKLQSPLLLDRILEIVVGTPDVCDCNGTAIYSDGCEHVGVSRKQCNSTILPAGFGVSLPVRVCMANVLINASRYITASTAQHFAPRVLPRLIGLARGGESISPSVQTAALQTLFTGVYGCKDAAAPFAQALLRSALHVISR